MVNPGEIQTRAEFAQGLQALRERAGLSFERLAERCAAISPSTERMTSTSTLQRMATGASFPHMATVELFVRACGERDAQPWVDARNRLAKARPQTPSNRQVRVGRVPQKADSFQDREVANRLREAAEQDGTVVLTQVLAGMGGVGKTQLAAAYADQAWIEGVGLLVWVNAASRDGIVAAYAEAARKLKLIGADQEDLEWSAREFLTWAETANGQWWLVVLDDVQRPGDMTGLWPKTAGSPVGGQVLVTTRLREAALSREDRRTIEVPVFTPDEARAYLLAQLDDKASQEQEQSDALADELGMLPLALAQGAAYIRNADITIGRYLDLLATCLLRDIVPESGHLTDDHERIITATWELSIDQASQARPVGLARPLLQLASVLDPAGFPQQALSGSAALAYLASARDLVVSDPDVEAIDEAMVDEALRVMHRYSLIDHDRSSPHREVRVHQLVQRATRENIATPGQRSARLTVLARAAADALEAMWPQVECDELGQVLRANTAALQEGVGPALWNNDEGGHGILFRSATSLGESGQVTAARDAYAALYQAALNHLGPEHPYSLRTRIQLAYWRGEAGDAAGAVAALEELLEDCLRVLGPDYPDTLSIRHEIARLRGEAGDAAGAVDELRDLVEDCLRVLGPDHPDTLHIRSEFARWRGEAGDAAGAVEAFEGLLKDHLRVFGPDHPATLIARSNSARFRGAAGDFAGAVAEFTQLVRDRSRVLGPDHPGTIRARHELAHWRGEAGDMTGAADAYAELVEDCLRVLGPDHPDTLTARHNGACCRGRAGDAAGAVAALEELLNDYLRVLGQSHPETLTCRYNVARFRGEAGGDAAGAVAEFTRLLADQQQVQRPDDPATLRTRYQIAHWQGEEGDAAGAVAALEELLEDCLRVLGPDHPNTLRIRSELVRWQGEEGDVG